MIVPGAGPIQNSCAAGARSDSVGIRAATDWHGGVREMLLVQRIGEANPRRRRHQIRRVSQSLARNSASELEDLGQRANL
jgi:hypothetical protein